MQWNKRFCRVIGEEKQRIKIGKSIILSLARLPIPPHRLPVNQLANLRVRKYSSWVGQRKLHFPNAPYFEEVWQSGPIIHAHTSQRELSGLLNFRLLNPTVIKNVVNHGKQAAVDRQ